MESPLHFRVDDLFSETGDLLQCFPLDTVITFRAALAHGSLDVLRDISLSQVKRKKKRKKNVMFEITSMEKGEEEKKREINRKKEKGKYTQRHIKPVKSLRTVTKAKER